MATGLLLALILVAWGAQAAVPARLARADDAARRFWAAAALPLALAGAMAAMALLRTDPDAALAAGLVPFLARLPGRLVTISFLALLAAGGLVLAARTRLEAAGWWTAAGLGLIHLATTSLAGELLRIGQGPPSALPFLFAGAACRLLVSLGAGELLLPARAGRPVFAVAAGLALPLVLPLLPADVRAALLAERAWITLAAAALLFLAARWLPERLRRPALAAAALLAGLVLARAAQLSHDLSTLPLPPLEPLR